MIALAHAHTGVSGLEEVEPVGTRYDRTEEHGERKQ
jgi:hypothetical protein